MEVLDYSSGYPAPAAVKAAGYAGVVRYTGTPGRGKNLTRAEAQAMTAAGIPVALVYEDSAGWMRGGAAAGIAAARAVLADAANCGVGVRCVYFACDEDVTTQMAVVLACLDGAATVLGRNRTGVYGEADVIDAAVPGHAAWGWQTRAWSGGRVSAKAHLLQQIGYVTVGGIQCDRNTTLNDDYGQWPTIQRGDIMLDPDVKAYFDAKFQAVGDGLGIIIWGDERVDTPTHGDGHPDNIQRVRAEEKADAVLDATRDAADAARDVSLLAQIAAVNARLDTLQTGGGGTPVDPAAVAAALDYDRLAAALAPQLANVLGKRLES